jgi:hypothetical protein
VAAVAEKIPDVSNAVGDDEEPDFICAATGKDIYGKHCEFFKNTRYTSVSSLSLFLP